MKYTIEIDERQRKIICEALTIASVSTNTPHDPSEYRALDNLFEGVKGAKGAPCYTMIR